MAPSRTRKRCSRYGIGDEPWDLYYCRALPPLKSLQSFYFARAALDCCCRWKRRWYCCWSSYKRIFSGLVFKNEDGSACQNIIIHTPLLFGFIKAFNALPVCEALGMWYFPFSIFISSRPLHREFHTSNFNVNQSLHFQTTCRESIRAQQMLLCFWMGLSFKGVIFQFQKLECWNPVAVLCFSIRTCCWKVLIEHPLTTPLWGWEVVSAASNFMFHHVTFMSWDCDGFWDFKRLRTHAACFVCFVSVVHVLQLQLKVDCICCICWLCKWAFLQVTCKVVSHSCAFAMFRITHCLCQMFLTCFLQMPSLQQCAWTKVAMALTCWSFSLFSFCCLQPMRSLHFNYPSQCADDNKNSVRNCHKCKSHALTQIFYVFHMVWKMRFSHRAVSSN